MRRHYIKSLGIECNVPMISIGEDHNSVHILSKSEIKELFNIVDNYHPAFNCSAFNRLADEYPIIFRLYYCCGMRNNEVCSLETADVDFDNGIITIRDGKNQKDRLVYLSYDMNKLLNKYFAKIKKTIGFIPRWLFPGLNVDNHIIAPPIKPCQKDKGRKEIYQGRKTQECYRISCFSDAEKFSLCRVFDGKF